jgi:hypothetical protein
MEGQHKDSPSAVERAPPAFMAAVSAASTAVVAVTGKFEKQALHNRRKHHAILDENV